MRNTVKATQKLGNITERNPFNKQSRVALSFYLLLSMFFFACQTGSVASSAPPGPEQALPESCSRSLDSLTPPSDDHDYYSWESTKDFSTAEHDAIESLSLVSENVIAAGKSGYRSYSLPGSQLMQEQLLAGDFRTILPIRNVDGWNLFVLAQSFAPDSVFIRSFVLLIEGKNGWQSRFLFPTKSGQYNAGQGYQGNYFGGYDIALYSSDLNYDGREELIFVSHAGGNGGMISTEIVQVKQVPEKVRLQMESMEIPRLHDYQSKFQDNFLVRVQLQEEKRPTLISRAAIARQQLLDYDQKTGKWLGGSARPWLYSEPTLVQPVEWTCNNVRYNLLYTEQPLKGLASADTIGHFKSLWAFQADEQTLAAAELSQPASESQNQLASEQGNTQLLDSGAVLYWSLRNNSFQPAPGNEVLEYESLLP